MKTRIVMLATAAVVALAFTEMTGMQVQAADVTKDPTVMPQVADKGLFILTPTALEQLPAFMASRCSKPFVTAIAPVDQKQTDGTILAAMKSLLMTSATYVDKLFGTDDATPLPRSAS